jgi:hypothetical protein
MRRIGSLRIARHPDDLTAISQVQWTHSQMNPAATVNPVEYSLGLVAQGYVLRPANEKPSKAQNT